MKVNHCKKALHCFECACIYIYITVKKYCWFNLKNEVTWMPQNVKFIEMKKKMC